LDEFEEMIDEQDGKCAICETELLIDGWLENNAPVVDHNHITGIIRGILCRTCNRGIGLLKDNLNVMKKAVSYLERVRVTP